MAKDSLTLKDRDAAVLWHPFTQAYLYPEAIPVVKASGAYLYTESGDRIIDAISSWWVTMHGHADARIASAIAAQAHELEQVIFAGFTHKPAIELAENLVSVLPQGLERIFYSDDGSTAVEAALKLAIQYWEQCGEKRSTIIVFEGGYHGDTFGAMSVGGRSFTAPFERFLFDVERLPYPTIENSSQTLSALEEILSRTSPVAILYEPLIQGAGGMRFCHSESLDAVLARCREKRVLCIADEVMTGFFRTGTFFASEQIRTKPDMLCISKGITGGFLPLGVTAVTGEIYRAFLSERRERAFLHGHSYTANPLACAAANASFAILKESEHAEIRKMHQVECEAIAKNLSKIGAQNVRSLGGIVAWEYATTGDYFTATVRDIVYSYACKKGVLCRPLGDTGYIMPPFCLSETDWRDVEAVLCETVELLKRHE